LMNCFPSSERVISENSSYSAIQCMSPGLNRRDSKV
jgi:hypothetical protein